MNAPAPKRCTDLDVRIGERIRARREVMRLTQTDVGNVLGISFQQFQKYEQGKNRISAANLQRVADLLGVAVASFYDEPGPAKAPPQLTSAEAWALVQKAAAEYREAVGREAGTLQVAA